MRRKVVPLVLMALVWGMPLAGDIHSVELKHRRADQLIPVLRPLLAPGETISGDGRVLAIRSSPETFAKLKTLVAGLDRAPRDLQITVRRVPVQRWDGGVPVPTPGAAAPTQPNARRVQTHERSPREYRVTVAEGQPVSIFTRARGPDVGLDVVVAAYPIVVHSALYDSQPASGFSAVAHIVDGDVLLEVYALHDLDSGWDVTRSFASSELTTRATVKPGQWLELGRVDTPAALTHPPSVGKSIRTGNRGAVIAVKVDVLE